MSAADPPIEAVAAVAQRLAVLLASGVAPHAAWQYLAEQGEDAADSSAPAPGGTRPGSLLGALAGWLRGFLPGAAGRRRQAERADALPTRVLAAAAQAGAQGENVADAIHGAVGEAPRTGPGGTAGRTGGAEGGPGPGASGGEDARTSAPAAAWLALAAAWSVAAEAGAPLAAVLRELAVSFRDHAQLERDVAVALAGPRATARLVGAMPAIAVAFGALLGFDTLHSLFFTPPGLVCLVLGAALMLAGSAWSAALVRRASGGASAAGLAVELTGIAMSGGMSAERARALALRAAARYLAPAGAAEAAADARVIDEVLTLSRRAGVPAVELLRSESQQARLRARSAGQHEAARLGVRLMVPLGLCVLPSFMLLGVAPMLISVLSSTVSVF